MIGLYENLNYNPESNGRNLHLVLTVLLAFHREKYTSFMNFFLEKTAAAAKSLQPCPTLCNPIDGSPPGSSVPGTTNVISVYSYYLALKLPISTSHCRLLTHFCLGDYIAWGRVLFFET